MRTPTDQQLAAIKARGNVLVAAGAGTGKTSTVAARCLDLVINEACRLDEILMVTFTEAAAAEMRERLRQALHERVATEAPDSALALRLAEEIALLDTAPISTLHSFCLDLVRRNFHALGLDPQFTVLDDQQTKPLIHKVLDELFERHYASRPPGADLRGLVTQYGNGGDGRIRELVTTIHRYTQALARPAQWMEEQCAAFNDASPAVWQRLFVEAVQEWALSWREVLLPAAETSANVAASRTALMSLPGSDATLEQVTTVLDQIYAADKQMEWEYGTKGKIRAPIASFFEGAAQLSEFAQDGGAALAEDWARARPHMQTLLQLADEFGKDFTQAKRELGGIDFSDQEQFALRLLYDERGVASAVATACREKYRFVFVDECQDINAAQDAILRAVSREGGAANRFLVGDVKQSIYRFRLADPRIFQSCAREWKSIEVQATSPPTPRPAARSRRHKEDSLNQPFLPAFSGLLTPATAESPTPVVGGCVIPLAENFRSREGLLNFINPLFRALMRPVLGGLVYEADAELKFGDLSGRAELSVGMEREPRVELHVITKDYFESADESLEGAGKLSDLADLQSMEREARLIAQRLKALQESGHQIWNRERGGFQPVEFRDMVVLLRGVAGRAEIFAKAFHLAGVPLHAERAGFLDALEVTDLLNLLRLLDNPLQDVPLLAVLRSPLVGMSAEELVQLRLVERRELLWVALEKLASGSAAAESATGKAAKFLAQFQRWRDLIRHAALTRCLEAALTETHYEALLLAEERGAARVANMRRFVELARRFDPFQREGLFRFLQFIAQQEAAEVRHEPAALDSENTVRLMTIHASKGLEFPVVVLAGMGTRFNTRELSDDVLLDQDLGLCPKIVATESRKRYPSIAHWVAVQRERRALLGEEMRLLYVALTRARDTLILTGTAAKKDELERWHEDVPITDYTLVRAANYLDWLRLWFAQPPGGGGWVDERSGASELLRWKFYDSQDAGFALDDQAGRDSRRPSIVPPTAKELAAIRTRVGFQYVHAPATVEPAKTSVSILRRRAAEADEEARALFPDPKFGKRAGLIRRKPGGLSATDIGTAHHTFMQSLDLGRAGSESELRAEAERMRQAGRLLPAEVAALNFPALAAFWRSDIGRGFRELPSANVHREMPFTARMSAKELRSLQLPLANPLLADDEFVVVQGIADLVALLPGQIWLLDFKTDDAKASELEEKNRFYAPQLRLYALALARIYNRPVTECWLHFLSCGKTENVALVAGAPPS